MLVGYVGSVVFYKTEQIVFHLSSQPGLQPFHDCQALPLTYTTNYGVF